LFTGVTVSTNNSKSQITKRVEQGLVANYLLKVLWMWHLLEIVLLHCLISFVLSILVPGVSTLIKQSINAKALYRRSQVPPGQSTLATVSAKDYSITVPRFLEGQYFFNLIFIWCCCNTGFKRYKAEVQKIDRDVNMDLDLISLIRRLRMHGAALNMILKKAEIDSIVAKKKNVDSINCQNSPKTWT